MDKEKVIASVLLLAWIIPPVLMITGAVTNPLAWGALAFVAVVNGYMYLNAVKP